MSRPKPTVLLKYTDPKTYKSEEVLEADAVYAVFYKGKPINLKSMHNELNYPGPKYKKTSFSNPGHAFRLRDRLNKNYKTDEFEVYRFVTGEKISNNKK